MSINNDNDHVLICAAKLAQAPWYRQSREKALQGPTEDAKDRLQERQSNQARAAKRLPQGPDPQREGARDADDAEQAILCRDRAHRVVQVSQDHRGAIQAAGHQADERLCPPQKRGQRVRKARKQDVRLKKLSLRGYLKLFITKRIATPLFDAAEKARFISINMLRSLQYLSTCDVGGSCNLQSCIENELYYNLAVMVRYCHDCISIDFRRWISESWSLFSSGDL